MTYHRARRTLLSAVLAASTGLPFATVSATVAPSIALHTQMASAPATTTDGTGLLPAADLERLLPATVWFSGQSAPLQLRNSAAFRTSAKRTVWAGLVDTSGYSTGVREKYQFYFVTEVALTAGTLRVQPGIYGGGFLADNTFVLLDVAGKEIGRSAVRVDADMHRPRPLQMLQGNDASTLRLYLGKQYLDLRLQ